MADDPYSQRLALLQARGVALWDVMRSCARQGSLDANIQESSIEANDFEGLFASNKALRAVYFNGAKAEQSYQRYVLPTLSSSLQALPAKRLPSTSPAHAAMSVEDKLEHWRCILEHL